MLQTDQWIGILMIAQVPGGLDGFIRRLAERLKEDTVRAAE